jgi:hypothetical protein
LTYRASEGVIDALMFGASLVTQLSFHDPLMNEIFRYLTAASPIVANLMLLPVMIKELMAQNWTQYVDRCHQEVFDVELATKMRTGLVEVPHASITDNTVPDLNSIDLIGITRSLNSVLTKTAFSGIQCRSSMQVLGFVSDVNRDFQMEVAIGNYYLEFIHKQLKAKIEHLQSWFEAIDARCTYLTQRAQAQTQTVSRSHPCLFNSDW